MIVTEWLKNLRTKKERELRARIETDDGLKEAYLSGYDFVYGTYDQCMRTIRLMSARAELSESGHVAVGQCLEDIADLGSTQRRLNTTLRRAEPYSGDQIKAYQLGMSDARLKIHI